MITKLIECMIAFAVTVAMLDLYLGNGVFVKETLSRNGCVVLKKGKGDDRPHC